MLDYITIQNYQSDNHLLFLDTETTGLPKGRYSKPEDISKFNTARLVELGYIICKGDGTIVEKVFDIIKPTDFVIDNNSYAVRKCHGITKEKANREGKDLDLILKKLEKNIKKYKVNKMIAHNMDFDSRIILSECYRYNYTDIINRIKNTSLECTMKMGKIYNKGKWPKLEVLYKKLLNREYKHEHRAMPDTKCCMECYFKMILVDTLEIEK